MSYVYGKNVWYYGNINEHATIKCDSKLYKLNTLKTILTKLLQQLATYNTIQSDTLLLISALFKNRLLLFQS